MSKQATYEKFCNHYKLKENEESMTEYKAYCENLDVFNFAIADDVAAKAVDDMKKNNS